jgi:hypothetical protein
MHPLSWLSLLLVVASSINLVRAWLRPRRPPSFPINRVEAYKVSPNFFKR